MTWNNNDTSYFEGSSQTLYICMHCMLSRQDFDVHARQNAKKIVIGSHDETEFNITKDSINNDVSNIPSINELAVYDPIDKPTYHTTQVTFNMEVSPDSKVSYIYPIDHSHDILLKKLKSRS